MKKRKIKIIISSILLCIIIVTATTLNLFTNLLGQPKYIYLEETSLYYHQVSKFYKIDEITQIQLWGHTPKFTLNKIPYCTNLKRIIIAGVPEINSFDFLNSQNLSSAYIYGKYDNWSGLAECRNLDDIYISNSNFTDFSIFNNMQSLTSLTVCTTENLDCSNFSSLKNLEYANIVSPLLDIAKLSECNNLTKLYIKNSQMLNFNYIEKMAELKKLDLDNCKTNNFSPLLDIPNLKTLEITNTAVPQEIIDKLKDKGVNVISNS